MTSSASSALALDALLMSDQMVGSKARYAVGLIGTPTWAEEAGSPCSRRVIYSITRAVWIEALVLCPVVGWAVARPRALRFCAERDEDGWADAFKTKEVSSQNMRLNSS
jgi:hypothetical protein